MGRVTFILGKGGVGRTTVARALSLQAAKRRPTLLLQAGVPAAEERLGADLVLRRIDPRALLDKAVHRVFPLGPITSALLKHPAYESFTEIAPALKELAFLDLVDRATRFSAREVIVDGPATGHGLSFLQAPRKAAGILVGHLKDRARSIQRGLSNPDRTRAILVTLPHELPVNETLGLLGSLRQEEVAVPMLVANRVPPPMPFAVESARTPTETGASPTQALALLHSHRSDAERWIGRLREAHRKVLTLPIIPGFDDVEERLTPFMEAAA